MSQDKFPQHADTTVYLWDYYFQVRVPYLQTTSIDYIRTFGSYTTGDKEIDRTLNKQWITTEMPIHKMVDHYKDGVMIRVVKEGDVKTIYDYCSVHLEYWVDRLRRGINIGDSPIEDLVAIDHFAHDLYEHAKYHITEDNIGSLFVKSMHDVLSFSTRSFLKKSNPGIKSGGNVIVEENGVIRINSEDKETIPERDSLAEFFKDRFLSVNNWKK